MPRLFALTALAVAWAAPAFGQPSYQTPFAQSAPGGTWPVEQAEAAGYPYNVPYGGHAPGGYEARIGSPYYWSVPGSTVPLSTVAGGGREANLGFNGAGGSSCPCAGSARGYGSSHVAASGPLAYGGGYGVSGDSYNGGAGSTGFAGQDGVPPVSAAVDPYTHHFGPGFYRSQEFGHYRFPYYSYRRPWYDVGHPVYARDTNLPW